ncbi:RxLR effector protein [Phytophthora megakarya]|uniref:RxLR effector protein n=1 Tax=Phytophthora megakarya TaxID=4795 RepID=A0A225UZL2_9STRA|nr:RxLR effector protein [Phytophthora megakarya]
MRLEFIFFVTAVVVFASSDALSTASTSSNRVTNTINDDVVDGKRLLRNISMENDAHDQDEETHDQDEERGPDVASILRRSVEFDDEELVRQFRTCINWFSNWGGKTDTELKAAIKEVVPKGQRKSLRKMYDMYVSKGEDQLHAELVTEAQELKRLKSGRRS